ncbi:MAG: DUF1934 domain-containing protein [Ruminiclostridium sp.]|nr:DUF1934 domain-containing protein [Ruminiclostridium sp.]
MYDKKITGVPADLSITSVTRTDEAEDKVEFFTVGSFGASEKGMCLAYDENEGIGYENCSVRVTASDDSVMIERTGDAAAIMMLEKGVKHHCLYSTPYGDMTMGINTFEIQNGLTPEGGKLRFKYSIDINSDFLSMNEMEITVKLTDNKQ